MLRTRANWRTKTNTSRYSSDQRGCPHPCVFGKGGYHGSIARRHLSGVRQTCLGNDSKTSCARLSRCPPVENRDGWGRLSGGANVGQKLNPGSLMYNGVCLEVQHGSAG